jgi:hypothetical protein
MIQGTLLAVDRDAAISEWFVEAARAVFLNGRVTRVLQLCLRQTDICPRSSSKARALMLVVFFAFIRAARRFANLETVRLFAIHRSRPGST